VTPSALGLAVPRRLRVRSTQDAFELRCPFLRPIGGALHAVGGNHIVPRVVGSTVATFELLERQSVSKRMLHGPYASTKIPLRLVLRVEGASVRIMGGVIGTRPAGTLGDSSCTRHVGFSWSG